jgi:hypothetical protein
LGLGRAGTGRDDAKNRRAEAEGHCNSWRGERGQGTCHIHLPPECSRSPE